MNDNTTRGLLAAGLSTNILFLVLALVDYARFDSRYMWPIFVAWAVLVLLLVGLAIATSSLRRSQPDGASPALARAVASLAARPPASTQGPTVIVKEGAAPALARAVATLSSRGAPSNPPSKLGVEFSEEPAGPFRFNGYTLYSRGVDLKNGGQRTIWFFSKRTPSSGTPSPKPSGFHVGVNGRTGLPFLKKGGGKDGEELTPRTEPALRPQCSALTADGKQCRNSARAESKYCASHFGYQPPQIAKAEASRKDTKARVKGARDTLPSTRAKASS